MTGIVRFLVIDSSGFMLPDPGFVVGTPGRVSAVQRLMWPFRVVEGKVVRESLSQVPKVVYFRSV